MNWLEMIREAIKFIESNLGNSTLSTELVANSVNISAGHFSRAFNVLTGFTVSEYIRNRRLSIAGGLLKNTEKSVLDVALEMGYESPEAFSKAYKRFHNINPKDSKIEKVVEFHPLQIEIKLTQHKPLEYTIEEKGQIILTGKIKSVNADDDLGTSSLWEESEEQGELEKYYSFSGFKNLIGMYYKDSYTIKGLCTEISEESIIINPNKWAIFKCIGEIPEVINKTWENIYSTWLSNSTYTLLNIPQLEVYKETLEGCTCEIWIGIE